MSNELDFMAGVAGAYTVDTDGIAVGGIAGATTVEVMHGKAGIAGDLVQTLTTLHSLVHHVLVAKYLVFYKSIKYKFNTISSNIYTTFNLAI